MGVQSLSVLWTFLYLSGLKRIESQHRRTYSAELEFRILTKGHSYNRCDTVSGKIKVAVQTVVNGSESIYFQEIPFIMSANSKPVQFATIHKRKLFNDVYSL